MAKKNKVNDVLVQELHKILDSGSSQRILEFLSDKTEQERTNFAPIIYDWIKIRSQFISLGEFPDRRSELILIIQSVALATFDKKLLQKCFKNMPSDAMKFTNPVLLKSLRLRPQEWCDEFILWLINCRVHNCWLFYWQCVQDGICSRMINETIIEQLLLFIDHGYTINFEKQKITDFMKQYPELLEKEFWYIFEYEFTKLFGFAYRDSHEIGNGLWNQAFIELSEKGLIDRARFLDVTLGTLQFNYPDHEMRWYSDLHRRLKPTIDEIKIREEKYLDLLDNRNPTTIALGTEIIVALNKADKTNERLFLQRMIPIFKDRSKIRPKILLGIVQKIAAKNPDLRNEAVHAALKGLTHESVDVQTAAAIIIRDYNDPTNIEIVAEIERLRPLLHSSVQQILPTYFNNQKTHENSVAIESPVFQQVNRKSLGVLDVPRLDTLAKLKPVTSVDELIDLAVKVLENPSEIDEIEMLIDGINRLHTQRDEFFERKTSSIRKSVLSKRSWGSNFTEYRLGPYLNMAIGAWVANSLTVEPEKRVIYLHLIEKNQTCSILNNPRAETIFGQLQLSLAYRISKGMTLELLSTPTHHGGWIDPLILVERIKRDPNQLKFHDLFDKSLSLYRLPIDHRVKALEILGQYLIGDAYVDAVRAILGDKSVAINDPYYQIAIQTDKRCQQNLPIYKFDLQTNTITDFLVDLPDKTVEKERVPVLCLSYIIGLLPHYENAWVRASLQWRSNLCPAIREPFYWCALEKLELEIEDLYDYPGPDAFLEPMLDPNEPISNAAMAAILIGLVAKPESLAILAQDILITAIADGRVDGQLIAESVRYWIHNNIPKRNRWIKRFETVSRISPQHAHVIRNTLELTISLFEPKEVSPLLELLYELCIELNKSIELPELRVTLEQFNGSGKAAKTAKKLLELNFG
ncbi:MAG: DUF6493 family protein [Planctomycetaceae bacterium]|jgi:hypothetical protein|nr:DUF6493 family protein [Planctomycetaceae bacterium]